MQKTACCPDCGIEFDTDIELTIDDVASELLKKYTGHCYAGDVLKLKEVIEDSLVNDFGISRSLL